MSDDATTRSPSESEPGRDAQQAAWILGMHRSGTSLTSKAISCLGYSLGPSERIMPPDPDNEEGFWEHAELSGLNEEILTTLGGAWHTVPNTPISHDDPRLADIRRRGGEIIEADFAGAGRWAWKDPRLSLTAPFWLPFAPQAKYVICLRSPQAVASSLRVRDQFPTARSIDLWFEYTRAAIENTDGRERLFVFYDDWMEDAGQQLDIIARFLGLSCSSDEYAVDKQAALEAIRSDLRHHQTDLLASIEDDELPIHVKALYLNLRLLRQGADAPIPREMDRAITIVARELAEAGAVTRNHALALEGLERKVSELEHQERLASDNARRLQREVDWLRSGVLSRGLIDLRTMGPRAAVLRFLQPWLWLS